jgi:hypothetical protein
VDFVRYTELCLFSLGERRVKKADLDETEVGVDVLVEQSSWCVLHAEEFAGATIATCMCFYCRRLAICETIVAHL